MKGIIAEGCVCSGGGLLVVGLGLWVAGPTFGAVLWATAILPILGVILVRHHASLAWQTLLISSYAAVPCVLFLVFGTVSQVGSQMAVTAAAALGVAGGVQCLVPIAGVTLARCVGVGLWTIWYTTPAWGVGPVRALQPVIALNGLWPELGDWSHQTIAYTSLTRLGQDSAFDLPNTVGPIVAVQGLIGLVLLALATKMNARKPSSACDASCDVPRGTFTAP